MRMIWLTVALGCGAGTVCGADVDAALRPKVEQTYNIWRKSMIEKDARVWGAIMATSRKMQIRNRLVSEKRAFPATVFQLPAAPPSIKGLRAVQVKQNGPTAKAVYFGKIDFGLGAKLTDNLLVVSFISERGRWRYDTADFVNLAAMPDVRRELQAGNDRYVKETKAFLPDGKVPPTPPACPPAKYIAKVYVFCPGRDVRVQINKISHHHFINAKDAEVVIGGARDGLNEVQFAIKRAEGGKGNEAMTIRVYLMSQIEGIKPIKVFEYLVKEGETAKNFGTKSFTVDAAVVKRLMGRH